MLLNFDIWYGVLGWMVDMCFCILAGVVVWRLSALTVCDTDFFGCFLLDFHMALLIIHEITRTLYIVLILRLVGIV